MAGYRINFHIHDEVILEIPDGDAARNLDDAVMRKRGNVPMEAL